MFTVTMRRRRVNGNEIEIIHDRRLRQLVSVFTSTIGTDTYNPEFLHRCVRALGYFDVLSHLCPRGIHSGFVFSIPHRAHRFPTGDARGELTLRPERNCTRCLPEGPRVYDFDQEQPFKTEGAMNTWPVRRLDPDRDSHDRQAITHGSSYRRRVTAPVSAQCRIL
jgi:hypothetical protein